MLIIGEIVGPQGIRGEVKVYPYTDFPERFFKLTEITIRKGNQTRVLHVEKVRRHKNLFLFFFREINDRNKVDELRGWEMVVDYDDAVSLPIGHYYDYQLMDMAVVDLNTDLVVGRIAEILHLPANAVYRVATPGGKSIYLPALKQIIKQVDVQANRMYIEPMEGLLE